MAAAAIDLHDLDQIFDAFYASVSGPPGGQDWTLSDMLFHPEARMVRTRLDEAGRPIAFTFDLDSYRANASALLANIAFYEIEIARQVFRFGNIAQVFSSYEARPAPDSPELIKRGLNMLHLYDDGSRWWIMHCIWDDERDGVVLPAELGGHG